MVMYLCLGTQVDVAFPALIIPFQLNASVEKLFITILSI